MQLSGSLAAFNVERSQLMIKTLQNQGVLDFCIAPGSRSTPLALAIGRNTEIKSHVHFDERGLGFYALGLAKATSRPIAILVTTGTATANLFPAVMEAHLSRIPLLILTADRPPELRDCGSNQTADHVKIFGSFTRWDTDLSISDPLASNEYIVSSLSYAVYRAKQLQGPVHINCMIREPFIHFGKVEEREYEPCSYEPSTCIPPLDSFKNWGKLLSRAQKGIILLGSDALCSEQISSFLKLAEELKWPIFSDIISGGRQIGNHPHHIEYFELILRSIPDLSVDTILQIGNRFVSKTVLQWIEKQKCPYFLVTDHYFRQDPLHKVTAKMQCPTHLFCENILPWIESCPSKDLPLWKTLSFHTRETVTSYFSQETQESITEPSLMFWLSQKNLPLYLSSSMPVRDADLLFYPQNGSQEIFCNRGASGIDGNLATAAGIGAGLQKPLAVVFGDLAALHDLSSLPLIRQSKTPIFCTVINNQGGGIFSFLPVSGEKKEIFETFIATSHSYGFSFLAKAFSIPYARIASQKQWDEYWTERPYEEDSSSFILECSTTRQHNTAHHQKLYDQVKQSLCSFTKPSEVAP